MSTVLGMVVFWSFVKCMVVMVWMDLRILGIRLVKVRPCVPVADEISISQSRVNSFRFWGLCMRVG